MRTVLQHAWANMNHDTGYKSGVEIPKVYLRNLSRLAGMLELVDDEFSRIRRELADYRRRVQNLVASGNLDEVQLDGDSFRSYLTIKPFDALMRRIASLNQAEIHEVDLSCFLPLFLGMGFKTLGQLDAMVRDYSEAAYQIACFQLGLTDIDIVSSSLAPQNLCTAYIVKVGGGWAGLKYMLDIINGPIEGNEEMARFLEAQTKDTQLLDRAIVFAVRAHAGTERRGKGFPYIVHPMEAVAIVATMTSDQELLAAAALHDTVEDTDVTIDQIRQEFGERVASIVEDESDRFIPGVPEEQSWHARKQAAIDRLSHASREAKMVALGDKLSNMRAIARDYSLQGDEFWSLFHVTERSEHEWHYRGLADALRELEGTFAFSEFEQLINQVFA